LGLHLPAFVHGQRVLSENELDESAKTEHEKEVPGHRRRRR
jgi:hypothetical protein